MKRERIGASALLLATFLVAGPGFVGQASATHPERMCPAPVSVCMPTIAGDPSIVPSPDPCPPEHTCVCVPSCPDCDDCAAQVCIASSASNPCKTACDCAPGLGCFDGHCIAGFAPVFCCERDQCPSFGICQSQSGDFERCDRDECRTPEVWLCPDLEADGDSIGLQCGNGRVCSCTASCQFCEDCGPGVCVAPDTPTPYRCESNANCAEGDRCVCVSSCPGCDDCAMQVCVPGRCDDPMCENRLRLSQHKIKRVIRRANRCDADNQCVHVGTDTGCQGSCGAFVNRLFKTPVERIVERIDDRLCEGYIEDGCSYATPGCLQQQGICRRGRCRGAAVGK